MPSSGIGGPCDHCGRTQSCCWRRGPAQKPTLCNACGSRYLVKKNLDGYIPIQQRAGAASKPAPAPKAARARAKAAPGPAVPTSLKPKRVAPKRLDASTWYHDAFDSEESEAGAAYLTDDSEAPSSTGQVGGGGALLPPPRLRSLLGDPGRAKVVTITSAAQLSALKGLTSEDVARLLEPSLRLKPRKPVRPRISVVF